MADLMDAAAWECDAGKNGSSRHEMDRGRVGLSAALDVHHSRVARGRRPPWPRRTRAWTRGRIVAAAIFCASLMVFTAQIPEASASGGSGGGGSGSNNTTEALSYPYAVPASLYPTPANLSSSGSIVGVDAIPFPGASSSFAVINASGMTSGNGSRATLWFTVASYSSVDAKLIATNGTCGLECGSLPLNWSNRSQIATFSGPISAEEIVSMGATLVVAATSANTSYLYSWSVSSSKWLRFGSSIPGVLVSLSAEPYELAVATLVGGSLMITTDAATNASVGQATVPPTGSGSSGRDRRWPCLHPCRSGV